MVVSSTHQSGVSNWWAWQSSHIAMFLIEAKAGNPPYLQCPGRIWASLEDVLFPAFRWMGEPHHYLPGVFQKNVPGFLHSAFHWDLALPLVPKSLLSSLVNACSGTSNVYPKIDSLGSCCCDHGSGSIGHPLPPDLASWHHIPACGQPLVPTGEPFWPLRKPHHVGLPSSWA